MKKEYSIMAIFNIFLGVMAILLYLPYALEAFDMSGMEWFKFVPKMLKDNYFNVLIYFGLFLLLYIIVLNLVTVLHVPNLAKVVFKLSIVSALIIPLIYVLALKNDTVFEFWIKNISPNIKMISYVFLCVSCGMFMWALTLNFTKKQHANFYHIIQALVMNLLLILLIAVNDWCGWGISSVKVYGVLMGLFAIYLPISSIILFSCKNKRI